MAYKKRFDTSSAYGQLIILVFLPICLLAAVGGILVFYETMRASNSEQEALAEAVLIRYTPTIAELVPELLEQQAENNDDKNKAADNPQAAITAVSLPPSLPQVISPQALMVSGPFPACLPAAPAPKRIRSGFPLPIS